MNFTFSGYIRSFAIFLDVCLQMLQTQAEFAIKVSTFQKKTLQSRAKSGKNARILIFGSRLDDRSLLLILKLNKIQENLHTAGENKLKGIIILGSGIGHAGFSFRHNFGNAIDKIMDSK